MWRWFALVLLAAAGCGDNVDVTHVVVRVTGEDIEPIAGAPIEGAQIAVIAGDADPVLYTTDADGSAKVAVDGEATVIVLRDRQPFGYIYVAAGVAGGTELAFGGRPPPDPTSVEGRLTVSYQPYPGGPWGYDNDFYPCSNGGFTMTPGVVDIQTYGGCTAEARTMYLTALDPTTLARVAFAPVGAVSAKPGTRTAGGWEPGTTYQIDATGLPSIAEATYTELAFPDAWRLVILDAVIASGAGTGTQLDATIPGRAHATTRITTTGSMPQYVGVPDVAPPALRLDRATTPLLPFVTHVAYDPVARAITWDVAVAGAPATLVTASFNYLDPATGREYDWAIYAPADSGRLVVPDLPDALTGYDLHPDSSVALFDLWLVSAGDAAYADVVTDADLDRRQLAGRGYRPDVITFTSGGALQ